MDIFELLAVAKAHHASDLHLSVDSGPLIRVDGELTRIANFDRLTVTDMEMAFMQVVTIEKLEKFQKEARAFIAACRGEAPPAATGEEGVTVLKLIDAIYASSKANKEVAIR